MALPHVVAAMLAVVALTSTGCVGTVTGRAVRDDGSAPNGVAPPAKSQLDNVLLSVAELNEIAGSTTMDLITDGDEMVDNSGVVSDPDCLGAIFGAEKQVYDGSGWTAVRDQIAREPSDDTAHWAEQVVVLYPSAQNAENFVDDSGERWADCAGFSVTADTGGFSAIWLIDDYAVDGDVITQVTEQEDADGWQCQHALAAVSNVTVETWACAFGIEGQAVEMARRMMVNAAAG